jgi:DNA topoisomerase-1
MGQSLVIVESVAKTKTINRILGKDYVVKGEAIAYHIASELKSKNGDIKRVLFNEITESAVKHAIDHPTEIDLNKVEAQKARRVLDRLVGYQVSPLLWKTIYRGLSACRVQSVALRLLCDREAKVISFVPEEYWSIHALLRGQNSDPFHAKLIKIQAKDFKIPDESTCQYYVDDIRKKEFIVKDKSSKTVRRNPYPPFTTSTMQQDAARRFGFSGQRIMSIAQHARRFGFSGQRIMSIAQQLYEGIELGGEGSVGLITYMRTDSIRIANEALHAVRLYVASAYGQEYLPAKPRAFKKKGKIQDAHEAIRPTDMGCEPKKIANYLSADQLKLYQLIWNRFVASQMEAAVYEQSNLDVEADEYRFRKTGTVTKFRGFLQVYEDMKDQEPSDENGDNDEPFPLNINVGDKLKLLELGQKQHFTKPPPRYNESTLIKELDLLGIGRPSTYATIIGTLVQRKYADKVDRKLIPTELGTTVNSILISQFPDIFNVAFTAKMENELDSIEEGKKKPKTVLKDFYDPFQAAVQRVDADKSEIKAALQKTTDEKCPECDGALVEKWGRNGKFIACSNYPTCRFTRPIDEQESKTEQKCELCGSDMVIRVGRFGRFMACSAYPNCRNTKPISFDIACPRENCGGNMVEKQSRRGKVFYGCSNYPKCDFATWYEPLKQACDRCGNPYMEKRESKAKGEFLRCPSCKYELVPETAEKEL